MKTDAKSTIETGKAILGIEFGSTLIKAVLIDPENHPIAQGSHTWENQLVDGLWTYSIEEIWYGLQDCYADLRANVKKQYDTEIETLAAIGVSAMMHGYMAFDKNEEIPYMEKHEHRASRCSSIRAFCLQHPSQMEHLSFISSHTEQRKACQRNRFPDYACGLRTLATYGGKGIGHWRCIRHASHRPGHQELFG